ncbi:MAG: methyltransferase [Sandaracinaceae bacterium]|nr:methyltransferase [Sandaracinaceae bacterium]
MRTSAGLGDLRRAALVRLMKARSARRARVHVDGLALEVAPGVCNPAPFGGVSLAPLYAAALEGLAPGERVLDVGTGCGVWALLAAKAGASVTATELPHVDLTPVAAAARAHGLPAPRLLTGDLFAPLAGERFARVLFNPPFHFGEPADDAERAYLGGARGEVLCRFLAALPAHLEPRGRGYVIVPGIEREGYADALAGFDVDERAARWLPVLGRVALLALNPRPASSGG